MKLTDPDRLFPVEPRLRGMARAFYGSVKDLPVISPHGHCEPRWFAKNKRFANPAELLSAVWVQSLRLQLAAMPTLAGLVQDIVITRKDRADIGMLVFPDPQLCPQAGDDGTIRDAEYCAKIKSVLATLAESATGPSNQIVRANILGEPPSMKAHEITAKRIQQQRHAAPSCGF